MKLARRGATGLNGDLPTQSNAAVEPKEIKHSLALRIVGKYPDILMGCAMGILVTDSTDGDIIQADFPLEPEVPFTDPVSSRFGLQLKLKSVEQNDGYVAIWH